MKLKKSFQHILQANFVKIKVSVKYIKVGILSISIHIDLMFKNNTKLTFIDQKLVVQLRTPTLMMKQYTC